MKGFLIHDEIFEKNCDVYEEDMDLLVNYICGNLVSWTPNRLYWEVQYNCCSKLYIVINWSKKRELKPYAKKGEMICKDNLVNFFENQKHLNCCGSV